MELIFLGLKSSELVTLQFQADCQLFKVYSQIQNFVTRSNTSFCCSNCDYGKLAPSIENLKQIQIPSGQQSLLNTRREQLSAYCKTQNKSDYLKIMLSLTQLALITDMDSNYLNMPISLVFVYEDEACLFSNKDLVELWPTTKIDLLIFVEEDHPSCLVTTQRQKEGKSLFNLFDFTVCGELGRRYLKEMISKPSVSVVEIVKRQSSTRLLQDLTLKQGLQFVRETQAQIKKYHSFEGILRQRALHNNRLTCKNWIQLVTNFKCATQLSQLLTSLFTEDPSAVPLAKKFQALDLESIADASTIINCTLDLSNNDRVVVRQGVSTELENLKNLLAQMEDEMRRCVVREIQPVLQHSPHLLSNARVLMTSIPNTGCFLVIPINYLKLRPEQFAGTLGWEFCFEKVTQQGSLAYFKNELTQEFEERYGDIESQLQEQEFILLQLIEQQVLKRNLHTPIDRFIAMLDGHLSLVCASESFNLIFPSFSETLDIRAARDLIQTFSDSLNQFFPIYYNKTQAVIEGSGKTTYLRCLSQLIYLAQCGCPLPVESATMPIFDQILTYFNHTTNIDQELSMFYKHIDSVMSILEVFTSKLRKKRVFLSIDNLGQSTSASNAIAFNSTFFESLQSKIAPNDIVVLATCLPINQPYLQKVLCTGLPVNIQHSSNFDASLSERMAQIRANHLSIKPLFVLDQVLAKHQKEVFDQLVK